MGAGLSSEEFAAASVRSRAASANQSAIPGVFDGVKSLGSSLRGLAHDHLRIVALETRQAGESLVNMIAASVVLAVLVVSAWLIIVAIGVVLLIGSGFGVVFAMLMAAILNLIMAFFLYRSIRAMSHSLGFPATIRSLGGDSDLSLTEKSDEDRA